MYTSLWGALNCSLFYIAVSPNKEFGDFAAFDNNGSSVAKPTGYELKKLCKCRIVDSILLHQWSLKIFVLDYWTIYLNDPSCYSKLLLNHVLFLSYMYMYLWNLSNNSAIFLRVLVIFQISSFRLFDFKCLFFVIPEVIALQTSLNSTQLLLALQVQRQQAMIYWTCLETPLPLFPAVVIWVFQLWATWICLGWTSPWWA